MADVTIDLWSDIVCPWCWIGEHRIQKALEASGVSAQWRFHAYELGPRRQKREPVIGHLASKYGVSEGEAREMVARVRSLGAELGLDLDPDKQQTAATFDAHRLVAAAQAEGEAGALVERLHRAHFTEGKDVGDPAVLEALAQEAGMDPSRARQVLATHAFAQEVEADEERARAQDITGVPFTVVNGRWAVGGAQSVATFQKVLAEALKPSV